jgi:hypothetical protein
VAEALHVQPGAPDAAVLHRFEEREMMISQSRKGAKEDGE